MSATEETENTYDATQAIEEPVETETEETSEESVVAGVSDAQPTESTKTVLMTSCMGVFLVHRELGLDYANATKTDPHAVRTSDAKPVVSTEEAVVAETTDKPEGTHEESTGPALRTCCAGVFLTNAELGLCPTDPHAVTSSDAKPAETTTEDTKTVLDYRALSHTVLARAVCDHVLVVRGPLMPNKVINKDPHPPYTISAALPDNTPKHILNQLAQVDIACLLSNPSYTISAAPEDTKTDLEAPAEEDPPTSGYVIPPALEGYCCPPTETTPEVNVDPVEDTTEDPPTSGPEGKPSGTVMNDTSYVISSCGKKLLNKVLPPWRVTAAPSTETPKGIVIHMAPADAVTFLLCKDVPLHAYTGGICQLVMSGYDINHNNSELLWHAVYHNDTQKADLLFKSGAKINNAQGLCTHNGIGTMLSSCSGARSKDLVVLLLDHILETTPADREIIVRAIRSMSSRMSVFDQLMSDPAYHKKLAMLYVAVGMFPTKTPPMKVYEWCHLKGLTPSGLIGELVTELAKRVQVTLDMDVLKGTHARQVDGLTVRVNKLQSELCAAQDTITLRENAILLLDTAHKELEEKFKTLEVDSEQHKAECLVQSKTLKAACDLNRKYISEADAKLNSQDTVITQLRAALTTAQGKAAVHKNDNKMLDERCEHYRRCADDNVIVIESLKTDLTVAQNDIKTLNETIGNLQAELSAKSDTLTKTRTLLEKLIKL